MNLSGILLAGGRSRRLGINKLKIRAGPFPLFIDQIFKLSFFCDEIIVSTSIKNYPLLYGEYKKIDSYFRFFYEAFRTAGPDIIKLAGIDNAFFKVPEIRIVLDERGIPDDSGPIAGIYSGIKNAANCYSYVLAFDMPFVSFRMIRTLVDLLSGEINQEGKKLSCKGIKDTHDAFIIKTEKGFEVLSGIYSKRCIHILAGSIADKENRISSIFDQLKVRIIEEKALRSGKLDMLNFFNINKIEDYNKFRNLWDHEILNYKRAFKFNDPFLKRWAEFFFR